MSSFAENPQKAIDGTVKSGSVDNAFTITVTNPNDEYPIENLSFKSIRQSKLIENIRIKSDSTGVLPPGASRKFTITFDIKKDVEPDTIESVTFEVSADGVLFDTPNPEMTVKIEKAEEDDKKRPPPVLKLVKIQGPTSEFTRSHLRIDYKNGSSGYSMHGREEWIGDYRNWEETKRWTPKLWKDELVSFKLSSFPTEIVMGEPFSLSADLKIRHGYSAHYMCHDPEAESDISKGYRIILSAGPIGIHSKSVPKNALHNHCDFNAVCPESGGVKLAGWIIGEPCRTGVTEKDVQITLNCRYVPVGTERHKGQRNEDRRLYRYRLEHESSGEVQNFEGDLFADWVEQNGEQGSWDELVITAGFFPEGEAIRLIYQPVAENPIAVTEYDHPERLQKPPRNEPWPGNDEIAATETGAEGEGEGADRSGATGPDSGGPVDPARLNPKEEKVSSRIREWISVAEPPENATEGANFRYDQWGRKIGTTADGATIRATAKPDYALSTPEETVWSMRTKLDSVNHCTLEEYVVAKIENRTLENCPGRYRAPPAVTVSRLTGLPLAEAKKKLQTAGLKPKLVAGGPAPTKRDEGTIASQNPAPNVKLKRGERVRLEIYGPYVSKKLILPNIVGLSAKEAKARLKEKGLDALLVSAGPAPSSDQSFKVRETKPGAGIKVEPGTKITLRVYSKYSVPLATVPGVDGMPFSQAKSILSRAGLQASPRSAGPAPSADKSGLVKSQEPGAGEKVNPGSTVNVYVFSKYVPRSQPLPARTSGASGNCDQILGVWKWFNGWTVHACKEKKLVVARQGNRIKNAGFWGCSVRDGQAKVSIYWVGERGRKDFVLSDGQLRGKNDQGMSATCTRINGRPDCRGPSDSRNSDCDLGGRFEKRSMALEFTTTDGIHYEGRLLRVDGYWHKSGYRPGMVYYKLKRIGPNDVGGSDYTGQRLFVYKRTSGQIEASWKNVEMVRASCAGLGFVDGGVWSGDGMKRIR